MLSSNLLTLLIWLPIAGGFVTMLLGDKNLARVRWLALGIALLTFILSIPLYTGFDGSTAAFQFVERSPWIPSLHSDYHLGVDGISLPLILLTTFITVLVVMAGWTVISSGWPSISPPS